VALVIKDRVTMGQLMFMFRTNHRLLETRFLFFAVFRLSSFHNVETPDRAQANAPHGPAAGSGPRGRGSPRQGSRPAAHPAVQLTGGGTLGQSTTYSGADDLMG